MPFSAAALLATAAAAGADVPKNVLFIAGACSLPVRALCSHVGAALSLTSSSALVDDMRPSIGAFNFSLAHTPNMDHLAATGLVFKRAYVQYAFCAPSRNRCAAHVSIFFALCQPRVRNRCASSLSSLPDSSHRLRVWGSFMSGRRPDTTRVWNFMDHFREEGVGADWLSMPEYFKSHGMLTLGSGK